MNDQNQQQKLIIKVNEMKFKPQSAKCVAYGTEGTILTLQIQNEAYKSEEIQVFDQNEKVLTVFSNLTKGKTYKTCLRSPGNYSIQSNIYPRKAAKLEIVQGNINGHSNNGTQNQYDCQQSQKMVFKAPVIPQPIITINQQLESTHIVDLRRDYQRSNNKKQVVARSQHSKPQKQYDSTKYQHNSQSKFWDSIKYSYEQTQIPPPSLKRQNVHLKQLPADKQKQHFVKMMSLNQTKSTSHKANHSGTPLSSSSSTMDASYIDDIVEAAYQKCASHSNSSSCTSPSGKEKSIRNMLQSKQGQNSITHVQLQKTSNYFGNIQIQNQSKIQLLKEQLQDSATTSSTVSPIADPQERLSNSDSQQLQKQESYDFKENCPLNVNNIHLQVNKQINSMPGDQRQLQKSYDCKEAKLRVSEKHSIKNKSSKTVKTTIKQVKQDFQNIVDKNQLVCQSETSQTQHIVISQGRSSHNERVDCSSYDSQQINQKMQPNQIQNKNIKQNIVFQSSKNCRASQIRQQTSNDHQTISVDPKTLSYRDALTKKEKGQSSQKPDKEDQQILQIDDNQNNNTGPGAEQIANMQDNQVSIRLARLNSGPTTENGPQQCTKLTKNAKLRNQLCNSNDLKVGIGAIDKIFPDKLPKAVDWQPGIQVNTQPKESTSVTIKTGQKLVSQQQKQLEANNSSNSFKTRKSSSKQSRKSYAQHKQECQTDSQSSTIHSRQNITVDVNWLLQNPRSIVNQNDQAVPLNSSINSQPQPQQPQNDPSSHSQVYASAIIKPNVPKVQGPQRKQISHRSDPTACDMGSASKQHNTALQVKTIGSQLCQTMKYNDKEQVERADLSSVLSTGRSSASAKNVKRNSYDISGYGDHPVGLSGEGDRIATTQQWLEQRHLDLLSGQEGPFSVVCFDGSIITSESVDFPRKTVS